MGDLERIEIDPKRLERWRDAAEAMGDMGIGLALELRAFKRDPTRQSLVRAAVAARTVEMFTTGEEQRIANATATEMENDAG